MYTQPTLALTIVVGITSGAFAATKQNTDTMWDPNECRGVYVGSDPRILINRPQNGMCDIEK
jgi:hypothetical protein